MNENLMEKEDCIQSKRITLPKDNLSEVDLYEYDISYSLSLANTPLANTIQLKSERCSDEELKLKVMLEVLKCLKRSGVIKFIKVQVNEENRRIDVI